MYSTTTVVTAAGELGERPGNRYRLEYTPEYGWEIHVGGAHPLHNIPKFSTWSRHKAIAKCVELTLQGHEVNMDILNDSSTA